MMTFVRFLVLFAAIAWVFSLYKAPEDKKNTDIGIASFISKIEAGEVKTIRVSGDIINIELADGEKTSFQKEGQDTLSDIFSNYGVSPDKLRTLDIVTEKESSLAYWTGIILPFLLPFLLVLFFLFIMLRQVQGANNKAMMFGQSAAREIHKKKDGITFKDVAGAHEAKEELREVVEFLTNPKKFIDMGAKVPRGVLLMGSPGTGKTLLAKAVAGEANVPFFSISGSEFVEMFVGVGASRVRDLFKKAKKNSPCIIFIDEIDAVGRQRGSGLGGSHDEREQTLNQILVEMDGFDTETNVIIIAATNRPDVLDPALLRPGRFDRRVVLDLPDIKAREEILVVHAANKPIDPSVKLSQIAYRTPGFSGADLANLLNEAAILAARQNKSKITTEHILTSIEKVMLGPERKTSLLSPKEKEITAYHEAGHALVAHYLPGTDPVQKVSVISRGRAAGYTLKMPEIDKHLHSRTEFISDLAVMVAGHTAEKEVFGEVTTGASNDLQKVTMLARKLITEYGMAARLTPRSYGHKEEMIFLGREITEQRDYSEKTAQAIDEEMDTFISEAFKSAYKIITSKRDILNKVAAALVDHETLEKSEFEAIAGPKKVL
ncbi:MAG: cell division protease FtsH [Parcubacteria group bacterium Gr01-1014_18]|nr:MAG: cell division protease FtsH [Parcubacteria group bacterium Greene0416_36]TSC81066.1 MAG: cell division protease FtsH [Parcubacteria group bacterium Gr01-1014_18]TSC98800.1 MAG: cell division protease FtsH [Parcubacteria group bacterium Greene1014_20]TSD06720.1 MAG: cell division protease FtsH [Parcubacteria group bacterium Greene0714_2]